MQEQPSAWDGLSIHPTSASVLPAEEEVGQIADEFTAGLQRGEEPDIEDYVRRYPHLADVLRQVLPPLQVLGSLQQETLPAADISSGAGELGDFRLLREVGRGGMGVVYEAEQISLNRRVALKVLPFAATLDSKQLQRFKNEAQAAGQLHHTNIVPVHYVGCERGVHFYAMQYIEGQSLAEMLEEIRRQAGRPTWRRVSNVPEERTAERDDDRHVANVPPQAIADTPPQARLSTQQSIHTRAYFRALAHLGIQAAEALEHAHELGVVHRDIKPGNLLVDARGQLWVTDFGLAQMQGDNKLTLSGDLLGTLRYMSPEQALAKRVLVDHRTDIYSLGATLYELLTLEPVFAGADRQDLLRQIAFDEPTAVRRHDKSIPAELATIVMKAMEKNPADRYVTAQEMADDLERFIKDEPIRARRPSITRRLRGWCRRHKPLVTGLLVLVVSALLFGMGGLWWQDQQNAAHARQRAATADAVRKDLEQADYSQEREDWPQTLQALGKAAGRLQGSGLEALQKQVEERLRQAALVGQLKDAQLKAAEFYADGTRDFSAADQAYAKAFADNRLDVATLAAEEIAARIKVYTISARLVTALDHWAYVKAHLPKGDAETLQAIARMADDDGWRKQLRDPAAKNLDTLTRLAEDEGVLNQPPVNLLLLCYLLDRLPGTPGPWSTADKAIREKAWAATLRLLRQGLVRYPGDFWLNLELGGRLSQQTDTLAEALRYLQAALAINPRSPVVYNNLGLALEAHKILPEAITAYRKAIECKPDNACAYHNLAIALKEQNNLPDAVEACQKAISIQPDFVGSYQNLGNLLFLQRKLGEAEEAYKHAIVLRPTDPSLYINLSNVLRAQKRLPEAVDACRKAIALEPKSAAAYINLGISLDDQKNYTDAEAAFRQAIAMQPTIAAAHYNLGNVLLRDRRRLPQAVEAYRKAIELKPNDPDAHFQLGLALQNQGKLPEAADAYRKAIELKKDYADAYANLGVILEYQGKWDQAEAAYRKAIQLKPTDHMPYINLGSLFGKQGRLADAETELRNAIKLKGDDALAYANLGNALIGQDTLTEAIAAYRKAVELQPNDARFHYSLGVGLRGQGSFADSLASLRRAEKLDSRNPKLPLLIRDVEQYSQLDPKLPKILSGEISPSSPGERIFLARLCQLRCRQLHAAAARFYSEAFALEPALADDVNTGKRYDAACAAALAGCGQGKDTANRQPEEFGRFRAQALLWLRADLDAWRARFEHEPQKAARQVLQTMLRWQRDTDFNGVRGKTALAKLPEPERQGWERFWREVEELRKQAAK